MKTKEYVNLSTKVQMAKMIMLLNLLLFVCEESVTAMGSVVFNKIQIVVNDTEWGLFLGPHRDIENEETALSASAERERRAADLRQEHAVQDACLGEEEQ